MNISSIINCFNPFVGKSAEYVKNQHAEMNNKYLMIMATVVVVLSSFLILKTRKCAAFRALALGKSVQGLVVNKVVETAKHIHYSVKKSLVAHGQSLQIPQRQDCAGVNGVYELSDKCQRVFDGTIGNICKNINIPVPNETWETTRLTQKYIHILALTETDEEVRGAVEFLKENNKDEYSPQLIQNFISQIKKIKDSEEINQEIVRRTRGPGELRFHATNDLVLKSIQQYGLSFEYRHYDHETFLKVLEIDNKAGLNLFPCAERDVRQQRVSTSTALGHCLHSNYARYNTPEWLRQLMSSVLGGHGEKFSENPEIVLTKLKMLLTAKKEVLTQKEIDLFVQFIETNLEIFKNADVRKRVFIVCKRDAIYEGSALAIYHKQKKEIDEDFDEMGLEILQDAIFSKTDEINEVWTKASLSKEDCSFLKPKNLDFFLLSPSWSSKN